jgi:hypothetical protein
MFMHTTLDVKVSAKEKVLLEFSGEEKENAS